METDIIVTIIGSSVTLLGILATTVISCRTLKESKKISKGTKTEIEINNLKEKRNYVKKKLEEFYYPLRNYLNTSKHFSEIFKSGKPEGFRTLLYLLNPDTEYAGGIKIILSENDRALLKQIFKIGFEIEKLITEKSGIIDDPDFTEPYVPSPDFSDIKVTNEIPLLTLAQNHIRIIRLAYNGGLKKDVEKYVSWVYPRELNSKVEFVIQKLEKEVDFYDTEISKMLIK